jgi:hypothetical protein
MPRRPAPLGALAAVLALAACSSGGFDGFGEAEPSSFADLQSLQEDIDDPSSLTFALDPEDVPTSGSASFGGVMRIETEGTGGLPAEVLGELDLRLDFGSPGDLVSGTAQGFVAEDGERLDGQLALSGGDRGNDAAFDGTDLEGTLSGEDGAEYGFAGSLEGVLKGDGPGLPTFVEGGGLGVVTTPDGPGGFTADFDTIRDGLTPPET